MHRAKEKIFGYIMANDWEYWATQTFSPEAIGRYDLDDIMKKYNRRLKYLKAKYNDLKWLIVPEQHEDGAWHMHKLVSGIPKDSLRFSGRYHCSKGKKKPIYNWIDNEDYGFNYCLYIGDAGPEDKVIIAIYITKYITKDLATERFNRKKYWSSKGLGEPIRTNTLVTDIDAYLLPGDIISHSQYYIKDQATGDILNKVDDYILYNPCPF